MRRLHEETIPNEHLFPVDGPVNQEQIAAINLIAVQAYEDEQLYGHTARPKRRKKPN
jgi:hypothetical protein